MRSVASGSGVQVGTADNQLSFTASVDHDEVDPLTSDPLVSGYELWVYDEATVTLQGAESLGKPTPDGSDTITVTSALLNSLAAGSYYIYVVTLGPYYDVAPDQIAASAPYLWVKS
jgi:hypothetical protein